VQTVSSGAVVENDTEELREFRRDVIDMLFVEGNHYCMFCEKSGLCELQALAYRFGITAPKYPLLNPKRDIDMSHPDVYLDHNRCILCGRCVRVSQDLDHKNVFQFVNRGHEKRLQVNGEALAATDLRVTDAVVASCPVGALMKKRVGYAGPGRRAPVRRAAHRRRHRGGRREAWHEREAPHRDGEPGRLLRLPHVDPRHRRAHPAARRAGRVRPLADQRLQGVQGRCAVGLVEGGCCNEENVHVLEDFRKHCDVLVSLGDCAINGGIPAMRNHVPLRECLEEAYLKSPGVYNPGASSRTTPRSRCCCTGSTRATRW
jgi:ferredoxin